MKIFISWSGETSKQVAIYLKDWLPTVIQSVEPFVSTHDIERGQKWFSEIGKQLEETNFGILCLSRTNLSEPWLLFEAGALSKSTSRSRVVPFLIDVNNSALEGPLAQFNTTIFDQDDVHKLLTTINKNLGDKSLPESALNKSFEKWWPDLDAKKADILEERDRRHAEADDDVPDKVARSTEDVMDEILRLVRDVHRNQEYRGVEQKYQPLMGAPAEQQYYGPALGGFGGVLSSASELDNFANMIADKWEARRIARATKEIPENKGLMNQGGKSD